MSKQLKILRIILGDQLNYQHSWFKEINPDVTYLLAEMPAETKYVTHHIQKICAFFLSMRNFGKWLDKNGHNLIYISLDQASEYQTFDCLIHKLILKLSINRFEYILPDEYRLDQLFKRLSDSLNCESKFVDSEHFFCSRNFLGTFFKNKKTFLMESFYREMRSREKILMNGDKPIGGLWNFDKENRKPLPKKMIVPESKDFKNDCSEIINLIQKEKIKTIGQIKDNLISWPVTREQALESLDHFCSVLLANFGTFQDAMHTQERNLFHSRLSFALNSKILSPREVIEAAIQRWEKDPDKISLAQIEGFVRQILGWREYMRGIYWSEMPSYAKLNFLKAKRNLPDFFWNAKTNMNCMKHAIQQSMEDAYAHHIHRLMITGNFAMLSGIDPDQVDSWYLGIYIDAIEWVEITNTRGMSQFADGGIVGSKPYAASSNYINKMSNYCGSCYYNHKTRYGAKACPFNSLYWNFFETNRESLVKNPRIGMAYQIISKMDPIEKNKILTQAQEYLKQIDSL